MIKFTKLSTLIFIDYGKVLYIAKQILYKNIKLLAFMINCINDYLYLYKTIDKYSIKLVIKLALVLYICKKAQVKYPTLFYKLYYITFLVFDSNFSKKNRDFEIFWFLLHF